MTEEDYRLEIDFRLSKAQNLINEMFGLIEINNELSKKPKNFVLDDWIDYQPLINGKTLVWYYCDVLEDIQTKVI